MAAREAAEEDSDSRALGALALFSILPLALPVLGLLLLARGTRRPTALPHGHERHPLLTSGRRGSVHVWRF